MNPKRSSIWVINPDVLRRFRKGQSIKRIAEHYGVKWETVHRALKQVGADVRRQDKVGYRFWTRDEQRQVIIGKQQGKTAQEIAAALGRTKVSVDRQYQRLCSVRCPDAHMRRCDVWYGSLDTRPAVP